ncbi:hypothetical protein [Octadecabacter arcticus]|uniref:hypothetical protein n=1 Tax=Octadecabacter arcticus TaxID=53946 RepID=UPI0001808808|nr:hypothetical protein [Octadecabacter arcticus]
MAKETHIKTDKNPLSAGVLGSYSFSIFWFGDLWGAATGDAGVIRFEVYGALPDHPSLRCVKVSQAQLDALHAAIGGDLGVELNAF